MGSVRLPDRAKVYLIVSEDESEALRQSELQQRAMQIFAEADAQVRELAPSFPDSQGAAWAQGAEEKAQRMGLKMPPLPPDIRIASSRLVTQEDAVRLTKTRVKDF